MAEDIYMLMRDSPVKRFLVPEFSFPGNAVFPAKERVPLLQLHEAC